MKLFSENGTIPKSTAILFFVIILLFLILYFGQFFYLDTTHNERVNTGIEIQNKNSKIYLTKFNNKICKNIAFKGLITNVEYLKYDGGQYILTIDPKNTLLVKKNIPLIIPNIYDFKEKKNLKIYCNNRFTYDKFIIDGNNINDSIIKNFDEDFFRIKSKIDWKENVFSYNTDFEYFRKLDLDSIMNTMPKVPIWGK